MKLWGGDIYVQTKLETYLNRPVELATLTYPEFFQWWQAATSAQQRRAAKAAEEDEEFSIHTHGSDDFGDFLVERFDAIGIYYTASCLNAS